MKICRTCGISKPLSEFGKRAAERTGIHHTCKACCVLLNRQYQLYSKYELTPTAFDFLLLGQGSKCKICGTTKPGKKGWMVDHDHRRNIVRGILCHLCNLGLGAFKDNSEVLAKAIEYLEESKGAE
jgi:Recombination endonuclease VII